MNYAEYLKSSKLAKITLALLIIIAVALIYVLAQVFRFIGGGIAALATVFVIVVLALLWLLHFKAQKASVVVELIMIAILIVVVAMMGKVLGDIGKFANDTEYETVQIVALKDSPIEPTDDFNKYTLGYVNGDASAYERSSEILVDNDKTVAKSSPYEGTEALYDAFLEGKPELMVLTPNVKSDLSVIDEEYENKIKVIFEKDFELGTIKLKAVDINTEPFTIYLCGADLSAGDSITSTGRGDVNILLTVNPNTKQVYMQAIPRDTFVYIPCRGGSSKLSYSGWWGGVQSSIESIEDKFDIEINYYAKINFNGLIDLVDALGGVTVNSHYTYSYEGYNFVKGENFVDGQKALRFARARKMLPENELSRGQHQMELIKGIIRKFSENPTYDNCMAVLEAMSENFVTNLPESDYYDALSLVVKLLPQLENMENHSIKGKYEWHYDEIRTDHYQYYYYPAEGEVERVHDNITAVLEGKEVKE